MVWIFIDVPWTMNAISQFGYSENDNLMFENRRDRIRQLVRNENKSFHFLLKVLHAAIAIAGNSKLNKQLKSHFICEFTCSYGNVIRHCQTVCYSSRCVFFSDYFAIYIHWSWCAAVPIIHEFHLNLRPALFCKWKHICNPPEIRYRWL